MTVYERLKAFAESLGGEGLGTVEVLGQYVSPHEIHRR
jgi:hypothetical protein